MAEPVLSPSTSGPADRGRPTSDRSDAVPGETGPVGAAGPEPAAVEGGRAGEAGRRPLLWPTPENPDPVGRLAELRRDWQARLKPIDEAERAAVDAIVGTVRRRILLERAELRVLEGLAEGRVDPAMPSLATLARHAARIEKDRAAAERELRELYRLRPVPIPRPDLSPERLEWLAAHLRQRAIESAEAVAALLASRAAAPVDGAVLAERERGPASVERPSGGQAAASGPAAAASGGVRGGEGPRPVPSATSSVGEPDRGVGDAPAAVVRAVPGALGPAVRAAAPERSGLGGRRGGWLGSASAIAGLARAPGAAGG